MFVDHTRGRDDRHLDSPMLPGVAGRLRHPGEVLGHLVSLLLSKRCVVAQPVEEAVVGVEGELGHSSCAAYLGCLFAM